jgi:hypothetical protein
VTIVRQNAILGDAGLCLIGSITLEKWDRAFSRRVRSTFPFRRRRGVRCACALQGRE